MLQTSCILIKAQWCYSKRTWKNAPPVPAILTPHCNIWKRFLVFVRRVVVWSYLTGKFGCWNWISSSSFIWARVEPGASRTRCWILGLKTVGVGCRSSVFCWSWSAVVHSYCSTVCSCSSSSSRCVVYVAAVVVVQRAATHSRWHRCKPLECLCAFLRKNDPAVVTRAAVEAASPCFCDLVEQKISVLSEDSAALCSAFIPTFTAARDELIHRGCSK